jgi:hypothetical protein
MPFLGGTVAAHTISEHHLPELPSSKSPSPESSSSMTQVAAPSNNNLAARMQLLIRSEGSMASIARRCGFSEGAVRSWRDGHSDISRERCVVMAQTLNISLMWLITGKGPMKVCSADDKALTEPALEPARDTSSFANAADHARNQTGQLPRARTHAVDPRLLAAALKLLQSYVGLLGGSLNPTQRADVLAELYDILSAADGPDHIDRLIEFHATLAGRMRRRDTLVA